MPLSLIRSLFKRHQPTPDTLTYGATKLRLHCDDTSHTLRIGGKNTVHTYWEGEAICPFWNAAVALTISSNTRRPSDAQLKMCEQIATKRIDLRSAILDLVHSYFISLDLGGQTNQNGSPFPHTVKHEDIQRMISCPSAHIEVDVSRPLEFMLSFDCDWDMEHGVDLLITDWKPTECGILH